MRLGWRIRGGPLYLGDTLWRSKRKGFYGTLPDGWRCPHAHSRLDLAVACAEREARRRNLAGEPVLTAEEEEDSDIERARWLAVRGLLNLEIRGLAARQGIRQQANEITGQNHRTKRAAYAALNTYIVTELGEQFNRPLPP